MMKPRRGASSFLSRQRNVVGASTTRRNNSKAREQGARDGFSKHIIKGNRTRIAGKLNLAENDQHGPAPKTARTVKFLTSYQGKPQPAGLVRGNRFCFVGLVGD